MKQHSRLEQSTTSALCGSSNKFIMNEDVRKSTRMPVPSASLVNGKDNDKGGGRVQQQKRRLYYKKG